MNREMMERKVIGKLADLFSTIGNPIRLTVLYALREQDDSTMEWQDIQKLTGVSGGSLKFHMDKLEAFNLIESYRGRYQITTKGIGLLYLVDILKGKVEKILRADLEEYDIKDTFNF